MIRYHATLAVRYALAQGQLHITVNQGHNSVPKSGGTEGAERGGVRGGDSVIKI